jgi:hypothetical protein
MFEAAPVQGAHAKVEVKVEARLEQPGVRIRIEGLARRYGTLEVFRDKIGWRVPVCFATLRAVPGQVGANACPI